MKSRSALSAATALLMAFPVLPAFAHPHVWVMTRAEVVYAPDGKVTGIRHAWTFDKGYSAFLIQGLDRNGDRQLTPDELQDFANQSTQSLSDFDYFTVLKANGVKQAFTSPRDPSMSYADQQVTLQFLLPLRAPATATKALSLEVYDPSYYVSFTLAPGADAVTLSGAPKGCVTTASRAKPSDRGQPQNLSETFFQALTDAAAYGEQFANRAIVACP